MPAFNLPSGSTVVVPTDEGDVRRLTRKGFESFNSAVLGLGDIKTPSVSKPAIAAYFDLQGFTFFCKQIEPHFFVPVYLGAFLDWIFKSIREETAWETEDEYVQLYHPLPFFTKFMGDGILVLWDTTNMHPTSQHTVIQSCRNIVIEYEISFLPTMRRKVVDPPPMLRCGIAKGTVYSVGNGEDFVGSCINFSARLQKFANLPIAFSRRGFEPEAVWPAEILANWVLKQISIRGIGENELVYVHKEDFEMLSEHDKKLFRVP